MAQTKEQQAAASARNEINRNRLTLRLMRDRLDVLLRNSYGREPSQIRMMRDNRDALTWALKHLPQENHT